MLHSLIARRFVPRSTLCILMKRKFGSMSTDAQKASQVVPSRLTLNPRERQLKELLVAAAAHIDQQAASAKEEQPDVKPRQNPLILRWAGGWVRDKLLNLESHDIDVAINTMTGETFALELQAFCSIEANRAAYKIGPDDLKHLHTIKKNPDSSKHLETATTSLFGLDLDFVNLRKETYAADSRNPQIEFGTAEEDALRRDATINALFYNLQSGELEDFTGGLPDLANGMIRTPLEPLQTFTDDPLRVLRLIRFASRLQFKIDDASEHVMSDPQVLEALKQKIRRERVGIELEKMLKGNYPMEALALIDRLGLYHAVFTDPTRTDVPQPDISNWAAVYQCLDMLAKTKTPGSIYEELVRGDEGRYFAWTLAALTPWERVDDLPNPKPGKPSLAMSFLAAREGFKAQNKLCDLLVASRKHRGAINELKDIVITKGEAQNERERFGMAIREWNPKGGWRLQVLSAILVDVDVRTMGDAGEDLQKILSEWQQFLDHLVELDVTEAASIQPLVNGTVIAKEFGVKPGRWLMGTLEAVMVWQFKNPGNNDPNAVLEELRGRRDELGIN